MMKKISRRSFLRVCGITAATAALTACGGGKTETAKKDDAHEAITFMAPYKEIEAFIEQVHSVYPEVNIEVVPYSGDNTTTCLQNMFAAGDLPDVCTLTYYDPRIDLVSDKLLDLSGYDFTDNYVESRLQDVFDKPCGTQPHINFRSFQIFGLRLSQCVHIALELRAAFCSKLCHP